MIAVIVLAALAVTAGVVVGFIALLVMIVKAIVRAVRGPARPAAKSSGDAILTITGDEELEFERIVSREWPSN